MRKIRRAAKAAAIGDFCNCKPALPQQDRGMFEAHVAQQLARGRLSQLPQAAVKLHAAQAQFPAQPVHVEIRARRDAA